jgi:hypothetical protein
MARSLPTHKSRTAPAAFAPDKKLGQDDDFAAGFAGVQQAMGFDDVVLMKDFGDSDFH